MDRRVASRSRKREPEISKTKKPFLRFSLLGKAHQLYDKDGPEAAFTLALKLGLKQGTARSWIAAWHRAGKSAAKFAKPSKVEKPVTKPADAVQAVV
jgi:hypothetical protein